ncbi:MAG: hypothetical protein IT430_19185 [Phycisphaerales bacterium]|nr:hypothetical protein [Phycisphaerales bacterium]
MAEAKRREQWARTSAVMALIANTHRDRRKGRPLRPSDFDPFARPAPLVKADVRVLKQVFIDNRVPEGIP